MRTFVTFGQMHTHSIEGKTLDKDFVAIVKGDEKKVFEIFGRAFCKAIPEELWDNNIMDYYPKGYVEV